jgi:hypothetical protein
MVGSISRADLAGTEQHHSKGVTKSGEHDQAGPHQAGPDEAGTDQAGPDEAGTDQAFGRPHRHVTYPGHDHTAALSESDRVGHGGAVAAPGRVRYAAVLDHPGGTQRNGVVTGRMTGFGGRL